jgi:hypothetical protein
LRELLEDPDQRARLAREGELRARGEFTWQHRADSLLDLYEALGVRWERRSLGSSAPIPSSGPASEESNGYRGTKLRGVDS